MALQAGVAVPALGKGRVQLPSTPRLDPWISMATIRADAAGVGFGAARSPS